MGRGYDHKIQLSPPYEACLSEVASCLVRDCPGKSHTPAYVIHKPSITESPPLFAGKREKRSFIPNSRTQSKAGFHTGVHYEDS